MARAVRWDLIADPRGYTKGFRDAEQTTKRFSGTVKKTAGLIGGAFAGIRVAGFLKGAIDEAREAAKVGRQTAAVIKATGGVANVTAKDVDRLASSLSVKVGVDDEVIAAGQNMLLTFKGVRNEAGKNNDIFNQATAVALDMTAALNQGEVSQSGLEKSTIRLGKALNDPIKGVTALTKVGVTFTDAQKEQIRTLVESGKTMEAQKIILGELRSEFGGAAEAAADPFDKLNVSVGNLKETLGVALVPALNDAAEAANKVIGNFNDLNEETDGMAAKAVLGAAGLGVLVYGVVKVTAAVKALNETLGLSGAKLIQFGAYGAAAGEVLNVFTYNLEQFKDKGLEKGRFLDPASLAIKQVGGLFGLWTDKTDEQTDAQKLNNEATKAGKDAAAAYSTALQGVAGGTDQAAIKQKGFEEALQGVQDQIDQNKKATREAVASYDGLISKSKVTADQVVKDLQNQVANFKTYARDTQRLIRAGVDPKAIRELAAVGVDRVHALATGTAKQLKTYKDTWFARNREIKGNFADSLDQQVADLKRDMDRMQRRINELEGKLVKVGVTGTVKWDKNAALLKSLTGNFTHKLPAFALGGRLPGYGGGDRRMILAEDGEAIVPKDKARRPEFRDWAGSMGIPGFADGGLVGAAGQANRLPPPAADALRYSTRSALHGASRLHGLDALSLLGGALGGGSGPGGWRWQMAVLRSAFPGLPLISGFRPGAITSTGNQSYHALGRAVDIPPRWDVFRWISAMFGKRTKELIFTPAGDLQIKNGRHHVFSGGTIKQDHYNHIHWAYGKGGRIPEDVFGVGRSGRTYGFHGGETVVPKGQPTINVTVNVSGAVGNTREVADRLAPEVYTALKRVAERNGNTRLAAVLR